MKVVLVVGRVGMPVVSGWVRRSGMGWGTRGWMPVVIVNLSMLRYWEDYVGWQRAKYKGLRSLCTMMCLSLTRQGVGMVTLSVHSKDRGSLPSGCPCPAR